MIFKELTDKKLIKIINSIDFSRMVTADDYIYLIARAAIDADRKLNERKYDHL